MSAATLPSPVAPPTPRSSAHPDPYTDGDGRFEVVKGVRVEKPPMSVFEQKIASLLLGRLEPFCRENQLGHALVETSFRIPGSGNDRKPDVASVSFQRWSATRGTPRANAWPIAPDLAVEVISPTDKAFDVMEKVREYFAGGVREVWHIYSNVELVLVFTSPTTVRILTKADELTGDPIVPGFRMALADLFPLAEATP
jgi:Uma2 family endonuclease